MSKNWHNHHSQTRMNTYACKNIRDAANMLIPLPQWTDFTVMKNASPKSLSWIIRAGLLGCFIQEGTCGRFSPPS